MTKCEELVLLVAQHGEVVKSDVELCEEMHMPTPPMPMSSSFPPCDTPSGCMSNKILILATFRQDREDLLHSCKDCKILLFASVSVIISY